MRRYLTVSDVARRIDARPQDISQAFYRRDLKDDACPVVGGRRLIPESFVSVIAKVLRRQGKAVAEGEEEPAFSDADRDRSN